MSKEEIILEVLKEQKIIRYESYFKKAMLSAMDKYLQSKDKELEEAIDRIKELED